MKIPLRERDLLILAGGMRGSWGNCCGVIDGDIICNHHQQDKMNEIINPPQSHLEVIFKCCI